MQEAAAVYRRLAEQRPGAFLPNLVTSLNNLSAQLGDLGRQAEARAAAEEAAHTRASLDVQTTA
jgi:hypothetical protein